MTRLSFRRRRDYTGPCIYRCFFVFKFANEKLIRFSFSKVKHEFRLSFANLKTKKERRYIHGPITSRMFSEEVPGFRERYRENVVELDRLSAAEREDKEKPLRFLHLPPDQTRLVDAVLRGRCHLADLPQLGQRVVRLFVSATFTGRWRWLFFGYFVLCSHPLLLCRPALISRILTRLPVNLNDSLISSSLFCLCSCNSRNTIHSNTIALLTDCLKQYWIQTHDIYIQIRIRTINNKHERTKLLIIPFYK